MPDEVLAVGYEPGSAPPWRVLATAPPHVVVVAARPDELDDVARHARLAIARRPDGETRMVGDERVLDELDDAARLFVRAWREQPPEKRGRPGEGLAWDHPGFEPPDRPPDAAGPRREER